MKNKKYKKMTLIADWTIQVVVRSRSVFGRSGGFSVFPYPQRIKIIRSIFLKCFFSVLTEEYILFTLLILTLPY